MSINFSCPDAPKVVVEPTEEERQAGFNNNDYQSVLPEISFVGHNVGQLFDRMGLDCTASEGIWEVAQLPDIQERLKTVINGGFARATTLAEKLQRKLNTDGNYVDATTRAIAYRATQLLPLVEAAKTCNYAIVWA